MNTLIFSVYKNTLTRLDGFNPTSTERGYTKLRFKFSGDDWSKCSIITAHFWNSADEIVKSEISVLNNSVAEFSIPKEVLSNRLFNVGLTGVYEKDGEAVTLSTNIVSVNVNKGLMVQEDANMNLYEQILKRANSLGLEKEDVINKADSEENIKNPNLSYPTVNFLNNKTEKATAEIKSFVSSNFASLKPSENLITSFELGSLSTSTGALVQSSLHIRSVDFIAVEPSTKYTVAEFGDELHQFDIFKYTASGELVGTAGKSSSNSWASFITDENVSKIKLRVRNCTDTALKVNFLLGDRKSEPYIAPKIIGVDYSDIQGDLKRSVDIFNNTQSGVLNAVDCGVDNKGVSTSLLSAFFKNGVVRFSNSGTTIEFPAGKYSITDVPSEGSSIIKLENVENLNIEFKKGAVVEFPSSYEATQNRFLHLIGCKNIRISGLKLAGGKHIASGIVLDSCENVVIENCDISDLGNSQTEFSSGIFLLKDNDGIRISGCYIHNIYALKTGSDGYSHATGIAVVSADETTDSGLVQHYSKNILIENCKIHTLYKTSGSVDIDGDGIYLIQRPKTSDRMLCNITIRNCEIYDCSLRCIKASCRGVTVDNCILSGKCTSGRTTRGNLADFQFADSSRLINSTITAFDRGCVAINYDTGTFVCENNVITGNATKAGYSGQGIILNRGMVKDSSDTSKINQTVYFEPASVIIKNNYINDVNTPIMRNETDDSIMYNYTSITIRDNVIGHFNSTSAVKITPERISTIGSLIIDGISFKYGNTKAEIIAANQNRYHYSFDGTEVVNTGSLSPVAVFSIVNVVGAENMTGSDGGGGGYELKAATKQRLGGVKIGSGVDVETDGTISVDGEDVISKNTATENDVDEMLNEIYNS